MHETRFIARFFALVIDSLFVILIAQIITYPLVGGDIGTYRLSSGLLNSTNCQPGLAKSPDGKALDLTGWQSSAICDVKLWPFSKDRLFVVASSTKTDNGSKTLKVSLPIDAQGRLTEVIYLDFIIPFLFVILSALLEAGRWGRTPGKWVFGLSVVNVNTFYQGLKRNAIRCSPALIASVFSIVSFSIYSYDSFLVGNKIVFPESSFEMALAAALIPVILSLIIAISMFVPWKKRGLGLHNKLAGTYVATSPR
jgi:uncharacterized RDD family membrane protein YckC